MVRKNFLGKSLLMANKKKNNFYAYVVPVSGGVNNAAGKTLSGITDSWAACERIVSGKWGARYKGFATREDAEAWLNAGARYESKEAKPRPVLKPGIYFDAGTGRGDGVEVSVTNEHGTNLLQNALKKSALNKHGKHLVKRTAAAKTAAGARIKPSAATNNYGELLALHYALQIARKKNINTIYGDSKLVIDYWSQWRMKRKDLPKETVKLAEEVSQAREEFEALGGIIERISGDYNPADLGFHR